MNKINSITSSVKWNAINSIVSQASTIITGIILMRLLSPDSFGLIGMITVFTGFMNKLKDSGLGASLIYKSELSKQDKDTVFWFNFFFGMVLFLVFFLSSNLLSSYYNEPQLNSLTKVFALTFIFSSLSGVHGPLLQKELKFKEIFKANIASLIISSILTIIAAFNNFGVWSLIILHLSGSLINTINLYFVSEYRPSFNFSFKTLKGHLQYSLPVLGTKSFNYWTRNADNFFIGSMLGSQALGFYSRAFFFVNMPIQKISNILGSTLFPSLAKFNKDKRKSSELLLNSMNMTAFATFPIIGGLLVLAEPFVLFSFGDQWRPMIMALQILSILTILESVLVFTTSIFYAYGANKLFFYFSVIFGVSNIVVFYIGAHYSIEIVSILLLAVYLVFIIPKLYFINKLIDLKIIDIFKKLKFHLIINFVCIILVSIFVKYYIITFSDFLLLVLGTIFYMAIYLILQFIFNKNDFLIFFQNIKNVIKI